MSALEITDWIININIALDSINNVLDIAFLLGGLILILGYPFYTFIKNITSLNNKKRGKIGELLSQTLILLAAMSIIGIIWLLPEFVVFIRQGAISNKMTPGWYATAFRWLVFSTALFLSAYLFGHENGGKRWRQSSVGHIFLIFLGLFIDHWGGILFITLPLLATYYSTLYTLAIILVPTSTPEDRAEKRKRFIILAAYTWGIQAPLIVVDGHAWKKLETRIPGDIARDIFPVPGFVWTRSHQVVSITGGMKFKRIEGPGMVFTGFLERPEQVFDLRLQLRSSEIDVVSKDGISFTARIFTAFKIDPEIWDKETYDKVRPMNTILRGADKPNYTKGSFPYSNLRVQAALGITSTKAIPGSPIIYWDQWALNIVESQARKVISQKNLNELWRPSNDEKFANAMDIFAKEIKENIDLTLRAAGILLVVARVVNFRFPLPKAPEQTDGISKQHLATWGAEWDRKRKEILADAQAESEHTQQEAHVYAEKLMLKSIAESLQKTKDMDPRLPQYVIAMRFLSTLQDHIHTQPSDGEQDTDREKKMVEIHNYLKEWQDNFSSHSNKEK